MTTSEKIRPVLREEDRFWSTSAQKIKGIREIVKDDIFNPEAATKKTFIVVFFDDTLKKLLRILDIPETTIHELHDKSNTFDRDYITRNSVCLITSNTLDNPEFIDLIQDCTCHFIILERYPLFSREAKVIDNISKVNNTPSVLFCGDLDELIIDIYIEDFILTNYKSFLLNLNEALVDPKVSAALADVQKMLDQEVPNEQTASSDTEWFELNLGKHQELLFNLDL